MRNIIVLIAALLLTSCATHRMQYGNQPHEIELILSSEYRVEQYTEEELRDPDIKGMVDQCLRLSRPESCGKFVIGEDKNTFSLAKDKFILAVVRCNGLERNRQYIFQAIISSKNKDIVTKQNIPVQIPEKWDADHSLDVRFRYSMEGLTNMGVGEWYMEIYINGLFQVKRSFEIVE